MYTNRITGAIDDAEWFIPRDDVTVQFRCARRGTGARRDLGVNIKRLETIRLGLRWDKIPVLRNRRRALIFIESPLDSFGPGAQEATGTDADMDPSKALRRWGGDLDPKAPEWQAPTSNRMAALRNERPQLDDMRLPF
mmetsp:Transcript_7612/g.9483  ORF Transcript_7612/g.9483 Transcript_7612/m.9483 type:complete len:138 (-) Transcript_7612:22-435(-)